jgi:hypothetical protein
MSSDELNEEDLAQKKHAQWMQRIDQRPLKRTKKKKKKTV